VNPYVILGPIGMMLVGIFSITFWKFKEGIRARYFLIGGLVWIISILPKVIMDLIVTPKLNSWARSTFDTLGFLTITSLYVGLRTGLLECGFTYLAFSRSKLKESTPKETIAFGIGFGAFEAILISLLAIVQIAVFLLNPSIIELLPKEQRKLIEAQLNMPTWIVLAPVIERIFTIIGHIFATLMIFLYVRLRRIYYILIPIMYKSIVDAMVPFLQWFYKPTTSLIGMYEAEVWVVVCGLAALIGTYLTLSKLKD